MTYQFPPDIRDLVGKHMACGRYASEDELLRDALHALAESEEDLAAIQDALNDWRAGDAGVALDDAMQAIRNDERGLGDA